MTEISRKKILVVDDNPAFSQLVEMGFSEEFEIVTAYDGLEGMTIALKEKPDIILMDVMMPKVSGVEMLRSLLSDSETRTIPVIVLTASQFDPTTKTVFEQESNVKSFLQKPCGLDVLRQEIDKVLG
jgi:twitching motility two-component system response regulator PilH